MRLPRAPRWWCLAAALAVLAAPARASAQEGAPPDSVAPDTVVVEPAPGELVGELADEAPDTTFAVLADPLRPPDASRPGLVVWDRERLRRSNATTLGELLAEMVPAVAPVRAGFFSGPFHLVDGPFGPSAVDVRIDGRPVTPMIGSQPDLSRILLAMVDEVRVERHAGGLRVDVTSLRRTARPAYSRVEAGTGDPDLESLRLVFANGFGSSFTVAAGFELLNTDQPAADLSGFSGSLAWMPGGGTSGVEVQYEQRSFERTVDGLEAGNQSRLVVGGRVGLTDRIQAEAWTARSVRELDPEAGSAVEDRDAVASGGVGVRGAWAPGWAALGARFADDGALPSFEAEIEGGASPLSWLTLEAAARIGSWEGFDTAEGRLGLSVGLPVSFADVRLYAQAASGTRGAPFIATDSVPSDSLGFGGTAAGFELIRGPVRIGGRIERHRVSRQLAFGTGFDVAGAAGPEVAVTGYDVSGDVPVLPLSWLLPGFDAVRVRGSFRHNQWDAGVTPLYVPANRIRAEVYFEDTFLEDDLGVRLAAGLDRRDTWFAAPGVAIEGAPASVPEFTSFDFDLGIRIVGVLIYWRYDNIRGRLQQDLPGFVFPPRRQVLGIRWAFLD